MASAAKVYRTEDKLTTLQAAIWRGSRFLLSQKRRMKTRVYLADRFAYANAVVKLKKGRQINQHVSRERQCYQKLRIRSGGDLENNKFLTYVLCK